MKKLLLTFFFLYSCNCFSQTRLEYGDFVQSDNNITWAAETDVYLNIAAKTPRYSIKNWYLQKMRDSGIIAYRLNEDGFSVSPYKLNQRNFDTANKENFTVYENPFLKLSFPLSDSDRVINSTRYNCANCDKIYLLDLFRVKQILYYSRGKLNISNILITPLYFKDSFMTTETTIVKNWNGLFNVAFNNSINNTINNDNIVTLGTESKVYDLKNSFKWYLEKTKILTARSSDLIRLIIQDIKNKKIQAYDPEKKILISPSKIDNWKLEKVPVTIYDSTGMVFGTKYILPERNYDMISKFKIEQEVFFDRKKEVLYSKIKSVTVLYPVVTSSGISLGDAELFKFYYNMPPSKNKK
jgi:hypothetical protein